MLPSTKGTKAKELYALPDAFFQKELRAAQLESLSLPTSLEEPQDVRLKPDFETACWSFQPPHKIFVGNKLFVKPNIRTGLSEDVLKKYIRNHYHHEQAHGMYTERDMHRIQKALKAINAPFSFYNLVEDAYIEHRYRQGTGYRFEWLEAEHLKFTPRPESVLFALIQAEGDFDTVQQAFEAWSPPIPEVEEGAEPFTEAPEKSALRSLLPRIEWYYRKMTAARASMMLMPLVNAWLDEFGRPPEEKKQQSNGAGSGMQDMELSVQLGTLPGALSDFEQGTKGLSESTPPPPDPIKADREHKAQAAQGSVLDDCAHEVDETRARKLAEKFLALFRTTSRRMSTMRPTKRISAKHYAMGRPPYRKDVDTSRKARKFYLEIDCSGSMRGIHSREGRLLVAALSYLADEGKVSGHVVLSGVAAGKPCWEVHRLPMAVDNLRRIEGIHGAEGLEYTLAANEALAKEADFVFIYTDAQICDAPINKAAWHAKGIFTWGLYAGAKSDAVTSNMLQYFDKAIVRATAEELVDAILSQA